MTPDDLLPLLRHMEWADARIWRAILSLRLDRSSEAPLRELLTHVHLVQRAFVQIWKQTELSALTDAEGLANLGDVMSWARPNYADARATINGLSPSDLSREIGPPWAIHFVPKGETPGAATLAETVLQVAMHSTHHRGQLATRVRALGGDPPNTDFIGWIWHRRPEPDWPVLQEAGRR